MKLSEIKNELKTWDIERLQAKKEQLNELDDIKYYELLFAVIDELEARQGDQ